MCDSDYHCAIAATRSAMRAASSVFGAYAYLTEAPEAVEDFATADDPTAADPIDAVAVPRGIIVPC